MYVILFVNQSYRYFSQYTCIANLYTDVNPLSIHVCVCVFACVCACVRACVFLHWFLPIVILNSSTV